MSKLLEKMKKARQTRLTLNDTMTLVVRRPTDLEATELKFGTVQDAVHGVAHFVVGWEGVTELDLVPGGSDRVAEFDRDVFALWLEDNPDYWEPLVNGLIAAYTEHAAKREADLGN